MGNCISNYEEDRVKEMQRKRRSTLGANMGIAMIMQQAGALVGQHLPILSEQQLRIEVRKAKAEGRTVTLINNCLYIDYRLITQVPDHYDVDI